MILEGLTLQNHTIKPYIFFIFKKLGTNFLVLATTLKYLGAKWLLEKKVNFVPCDVQESR